MKQDKDRWD